MTAPPTPSRPRARDLGVPFDGDPGEHDAITDVPGVEVGYTTLIDGDGPLEVGRGPVRTGVTALLPLGHAGVGRACAAGWHSLNGNGEMTGTTFISESGSLSTPVLVTSTHAVGACHEGLIAWMVDRDPALAGGWLLPVVAETWDGYLNDVNGRHVRPEHAAAALEGATSGPVAEGAVGGGTGMTCYGFKGGSGTASRRVRLGDGSEHVVGVFVQANFGHRAELTVAGVPLGRELVDDDPEGAASGPPPGSGSVIVVVATDAPLLPGQCAALARRATLGLARTGTTGSHYSGDIFLAFSTANPDVLSDVPARVGDQHRATLTFVVWGAINPLYDAVVQATEEAVVNALVAAETMIGVDGRRSPGLPHDVLRRTRFPARSR